MPNEIEAGRAAMPDAEISQEAARKLLWSLRLLLTYEPGGTPPMTMPRGIALDHARAAIALAERGA
jgi:hypothetical protein